MPVEAATRVVVPLTVSAADWVMDSAVTDRLARLCAPPKLTESVAPPAALMVNAPVVPLPKVSPRSVMTMVSLPDPPLIVTPAAGLKAVSRSVNVALGPFVPSVTDRLFDGFVNVVVTKFVPLTCDVFAAALSLNTMLSAVLPNVIDRSFEPVTLIVFWLTPVSVIVGPPATINWPSVKFCRLSCSVWPFSTTVTSSPELAFSATVIFVSPSSPALFMKSSVTASSSPSTPLIVRFVIPASG